MFFRELCSDVSPKRSGSTENEKKRASRRHLVHSSLRGPRSWTVTVFEPCSASVAAASVLVGKIDPGLNLSHRVFDEAHGPLAMAALVRRRRLQGLHRGFERGQGALHIALIGQSGRRCERQSGRGGDAGGRHQEKIAAAGSGSHCFLFLYDRGGREAFLGRVVPSNRPPVSLS